MAATLAQVGDAGEAGGPAIIAGGTGLYFNALTRGIANDAACARGYS